MNLDENVIGYKNILDSPVVKLKSLETTREVS